MEIAARVRELYKQGRFAESANLLQTLQVGRLDTSTALLKAAVCEMIGDLSSAETIANQVARGRSTSDSQRAAAELILGRIAGTEGNAEDELLHLQKSLACAERAHDSDQIGWAQLRLLAVHADRSGADVCRPLMSSLRTTVSCAGNPTLSAALHLVVADADGKRGLLAKSRKHVHLAISLLSRYPNIWLEGWAENTLLALSIVQCDIPAALSHGTRALALGRESGAATLTRSALANLGRLHYTIGDYQMALEFLNQGLEGAVGETNRAIVESIARVYMAQGRLSESAVLLANVEISDRGSVTSGGYIHRHSLLTKAELLTRCGNRDEAASYFREAIELSKQSDDSILEDAVRYLTIEAKISGRCQTDGSYVAPPHHWTPDTSVLYERALCSQLIQADQIGFALAHRDRAIRTCRAVTNRPAETDVMLAWTSRALDNDDLSVQPASHFSVLQEISSLLMHAGRPELVAAGLIAVLQHSFAVTAARAVARGADSAEEVLGAWGDITVPAAVRAFAIGTSRDRTIELQIQPLPDVESQATVNAIAFIIAAGQDIERARIEREERLTLWPVDELPAEDDDSVVAGRMRDVMLSARKVAQANVRVLLTGESGTGKEVVARAIHRYSARAKKPFVAFNCTAVPRELMESHLFGFKRGAFTGADRDNPGLIRAAKDGTLFLDEIGELSLDLQPKLLRFLESGEIHPLGETVPFSVNVRIVAATNANLQKLIEEGKFREDLYYRLNVIPIELPPLRDRREEIEPLAQYFALKWSHELGKGCIRVAPDLLAHLVLYPWPGNIRQLSNEIHRMVALAEPNAPLTLEHFPKALREETEILKRRANGLEMTVPLTGGLDQAISKLEREMITHALRESNGRVEAAAKALGISRKGLYLKRQRLGL